MLAAVLHFVPEEANPDRITAVLREALPGGSYLVISHVAADFPWGDRNNEETLKRALKDMYPRTRERVADFFGGVGNGCPWCGAGISMECHRGDGRVKTRCSHLLRSRSQDLKLDPSSSPMVPANCSLTGYGSYGRVAERPVGKSSPAACRAARMRSAHDDPP